MNPKLGRAIASAVACGCLALYGNTLAQQQGEPQKQQQQQQEQKQQPQQKSGEADRAAGGTTADKSAQKKDAPVAGRIPLGVTVIETEAIAKGYRVSKLIGAQVKNDKGERIGKIEEMIVSPDGKVTMAIVEVGGFLDLGDHRVAIPVQQFSSLEPGGAVLPGASKTALKKLPEFQYARA
jgi:sporulation protein YlmC with PRC-barrel domain